MYPLFHKGFLHLWCILNNWFHTEGSWPISIERANPRLLSTNAQICSSPTHTSKAGGKRMLCSTHICFIQRSRDGSRSGGPHVDLEVTWAHLTVTENVSCTFDLSTAVATSHYSIDVSHAVCPSLRAMNVEGNVLLTMKIGSPSGHPRCRWVCFFIRFGEM